MDIRAVLLVLVFVSFKATEANQDLYRLYDLNRDGKVHPIEVKMSWMSWSNNMVYWSEDATFLYFDRDGDGQLSEPEFRQYEKNGVGRYYFTLADADADGNVTAGEFRGYFQRSGWSEEAIEKLVVKNFGGEEGKWKFADFNKWLASVMTDKDFAREDFKVVINGVTPDRSRLQTPNF